MSDRILTAPLPDTAASSSGPAVYGKIARRILPFLIVCYLMAYLDRVNIGFAKLRMLEDLSFTEAAYGLGAGLFFIGYLLFEAPSNILMMKIGAKKTIMRIMVLWGLISMGFAFVQTPTQFYFLRFLLGVAEAGFYPGIILYLTFWFPSRYRGKMLALFVTAIPLSGVIGGPLSGWILQSMDQAHGFAGWQWLFLIEGLPSVLLGLAVPWFLTDSPHQAKWLSAEEKRNVLADLEEDAQRKTQEGGDHSSILAMLADRRVWTMVALCVCQAIGIYGVSFWLPSLVSGLGYQNVLQIGLISAAPFGAAAIALNLVGRSSDRRLERRWHLIGAFLVGAAGLVASVWLHNTPIAALVALTVATAGVYSATTMMWMLPSLFLNGVGMAAAIGVINSIGGLGGFVSPYVIGLIKDSTQSTSGGIYFIAVVAVIGAVLTYRLPKSLVNR
ncbi:putative tartrate transporter [compost metagenome]|uniref:Tartrate transporter n=1 Tax=Achromobacter agilis TaxID=1353888 RepID=A0A446CGT4_9BURK|nr:MFS transporter [Achromobacter agilis]SSW67059.1 Putative tartrate transporter [Achromobacter agilis]